MPFAVLPRGATHSQRLDRWLSLAGFSFLPHSSWPGSRGSSTGDVTQQDGRGGHTPTRFHMHALQDYLRGTYVRTTMDLRMPERHTRANVPAEPGWYYIETNAPLEVLSRQALWARQYQTKRTGKLTKVKNYDLQLRCSRFDPALAAYLNTQRVYSGYASNLRSRMREHTFADPGTGGLALSKYPELHEFEWHFCFRSLAGFMPECTNPGVLLLLGEQIWRSQNGWPILCAE